MSDDIYIAAAILLFILATVVPPLLLGDWGFYDEEDDEG